MTVDINIVLYKPRWDEFRAAVESLAAARDEFDNINVLLSGTNAESDTLTRVINETALDLKIRVFHRHDNIGFAGGHNLLAAKSFENGATFCLVFNPDVICRPGAIRAFVEKVRGWSDKPALFGPILRTNDDQGRTIIDSAGILWSSSGRHFDSFQGEFDRGFAEFRVVEGLTGACLLVPRSAYMILMKSSGELFDKSFVAFREDAELGIRSAALGISSISVDVPGFFHGRGNPGTARTNPLVNMLGVQNRFLMRQKLGSLRPGTVIVSFARDLTVVAGCLLRERSSLPGLTAAFNLRRYCKYGGQILRSQSGGSRQEPGARRRRSGAGE